MDAMSTRSQVTNQKVAEELLVTHSAVSRIRSGDRFPGLTLIQRIANLFGWSVDEQVRLIGSPSYAEEFEKVLIRRYDVGVQDVAGVQQ